MARKQKKYHYIYKTTCSITGRYYIGMHSTDSLEDKYIGSGKRLWYSIRKHGLSNHSKEILEFLDSRQSLKDRESQLVNIDTLKDPMCMNIKVGGDGGNIGIDGNPLGGDKFRAVHQYRKEHPEILSTLATKTFTNAWKTTKYREKMKSVKKFNGKQHSTKTKELIGEKNSINQAGTNNSQYGTVWITNGLLNKKINKDSTIPNGWYKGRIIKNNALVAQPIEQLIRTQQVDGLNPS